MFLSFMTPINFFYYFIKRRSLLFKKSTRDSFLLIMMILNSSGCTDNHRFPYVFISWSEIYNLMYMLVSTFFILQYLWL